MTKRTTGLRFPEGATDFGTASLAPAWPNPAASSANPGYAQKKLAELHGTKPAHSFDDIADGAESAGANTPAYRREATPSLGMAKPKKAPKYRNTKCEQNGIRFDSLKERARWLKLIERQAAGQIRDLELQVAFVLTPRKQRDDGTWERASKYVADFVYVEVATGKRVVEDVKSPATRKNTTYVQKRKQMLAVHDITIKEI